MSKLPNTITVGLRDHSMMLVDAEPHQIPELSEYFSFMVPGAKFMPMYKARKWDGKIKLFNQVTRELNVGLYEHLKKFCQDRMYPLQLLETDYGHPAQKNHVQHQNLIKFQSELKMPYELRDYQYDAVTHGIENKRAILLSPTGSGKSFIIYNLLRWYIDNYDHQILIVVPTTSLVEQMYKDFEDYGLDVENQCHKIYSGKDKTTDKQIIISTWQSIYKFSKEWFEDFGCVFGDEVHLFKAKSLSGIMNKCINAEYRFGTTGTLDGTETNKLVLEGLFGPVMKVTTTSKLQKEKKLANLNIDIIQLQYAKEIRDTLKEATYQDEIDFIVSCDARNRFIRNLACSLEGNTLILFNLVEKHGKVLRDLIEDKLEDGRRLFYVSGEVKANDREAIRKIVESQSNSITLASLGTFSTGINIRNIHNVVFASPSKSQIRVLQSIGRGLRISDDGSTTRLYDIADDLRYEGKPNFTLRHSAERIKIYKSEQFNYKINQVGM